MIRRKKEKPITYKELQKRIHNRYQTMKKDNGGNSLPGNKFQEVVRILLSLNNVDYKKGKGKKWYNSLMMEFASRGGNKSAKVPKKKRN